MTRVALVTGAGAGIGAAIARRFAAEGYVVFAADVDVPAASAVAKAICRAGSRATALQMDVGQGADIDRAFQTIERDAGRLDVLVNNAGIAPPQSLFEIRPDDWERVIRVNLTGTFLSAQAAARLMTRQGGGCIINVASANAVAAHPDLIHYAASKGGIVSLTKALAVALAEYHIRVNAIGPGSVRTPMTEARYARPGTLAGVLSRIPLGRIAEPEEIAGIAAFLASADGSYLTGITIYADGGRLALNGVMPAR